MCSISKFCLTIKYTEMSRPFTLFYFHFSKLLNTHFHHHFHYTCMNHSHMHSSPFNTFRISMEYILTGRIIHHYHHHTQSQLWPVAILVFQKFNQVSSAISLFCHDEVWQYLLWFSFSGQCQVTFHSGFWCFHIVYSHTQAYFRSTAGCTLQ